MPVDLEQMEERARAIGHGLVRQLPRGVGFTLMLYDFGADGHMTYISNAERATMLKALRECINVLEHDGDSVPIAQQH